MCGCVCVWKRKEIRKVKIIEDRTCNKFSAAMHPHKVNRLFVCLFVHTLQFFFFDVSLLLLPCMVV